MMPDDLQAEIEKLRKENQMLTLNVEELSKTNEFLVSATWREREMKSRLHSALEELKMTKKLVDEQHKSITDSINYASRIQDAIIPKYQDLKTKFTDVFMYHQAKDVVSGDFPWYFEKDEFIYIAAVDCTGHGVPGAMMSLVGHLLLNDIAKHNAIDTAALLNQLHVNVVSTLKQTEEGRQTSDGMDIALCRIDTKRNEVQFSGAHRPLLYVTDEDLQVFKGDKFPIGGNQYRGRTTFTNHNITVKEGDSIYFFSDGLTDQFGGPNGQKFGAQRVREIITQKAHLSMVEVHHLIRKAYEDWKGDLKQIDDLLIIGIRF